MDLGCKDGGIAVPNMGYSQVNYVYIATKRAILKGKTITIFNDKEIKFIERLLSMTITAPLLINMAIRL